MDMSIIAGARLRERPFEYAANGVTVVLKAGRGVGATGQVDGDNSGKIYTAVNETQLRAIINEGDANTDLTGFCTTLVTNMEGTQPDLEVIPFINVDSNQNISSWDVSNVTDMKNMFNRATSFNQPLNNWDVSNVTDMKNMFNRATSFNQPLNNWDVSSVTDMAVMFNRATSFNQPLNNWDVSNVTNMNFMFAIAEAFNQDISNWCVTNIASEPNQFDTGADAWVLSNSRPVWGTCP
jgi:surface protein